MPRYLQPGQSTQVWLSDTDGNQTLIFQSDQLLLEAPNWAPDGNLLLNGHGVLFELPAREGGELRQIEIEALPPINNDHVLTADGDWLYLSADDGHIHRAPREGGTAERVTSRDDQGHYLHGISPDSTTLAYVTLERGNWDQPARLALLNLETGEETRLDAGPGHVDGPEFTSDGEHLLLNTEAFTDAPGHAQIAAYDLATDELRRLVVSDTVDWFPHESPDGELAIHLSYGPGTQGHPENLPVEIKLVRLPDWQTAIHTIPLFGGQGTINVNSWSPASDAFAYVAYPFQT